MVLSFYWKEHHKCNYAEIPDDKGSCCVNSQLLASEQGDHCQQVACRRGGDGGGVEDVGDATSGARVRGGEREEEESKGLKRGDKGAGQYI